MLTRYAQDDKYPAHEVLISALQMNREPLWPSNYANTTSYNIITKLNQVRLTNNASFPMLKGRARSSATS